MDEIHSDTILQLTGAFLNPTYEEAAVVAFIIERECDRPFCCDVHNYSYNIASQALNSNKNFIWDNYFANNHRFFL